MALGVALISAGCARSALKDPTGIDKDASMWRKLRASDAGGTTHAGTDDRSREIERNLGVY
jgi:hypothetical protein